MNKIRPYIATIVIILCAISAFELIPNISIKELITSLSDGIGNTIYWIVSFVLACAGITLFSMSGIVKRNELTKVVIFRLCWCIGAGLLGYGAATLVNTSPGDSIFSGQFTKILLYAIIILFTSVIYFNAAKRAGKKVSSNSIRRSAASSGTLKYAYGYFYSALIWSVLFGLIIVLFFQDSTLPGDYFFPCGAASLLMFVFFFVRFKIFPLLSLITLLLQFFASLYQGLIISQIDLPYYSILLYLSTATVLPLIDMYCRDEI
ncbi:MAG: hypothetical protein HUJ92_06320 [Bacteroidales bacterium]|nr:hypothetical protein [Bacteroidales bacterium]